jgi:toll-like receptor 13
LIALAFKKRFHISNLVFRLQERLGHGSDDRSNSGYTYDAFVSYSNVDEDRLWVHYVLLKKLEKEFGFRLCIHHRNFPGGVYIGDNIEKAIRSSRKVVLIMSENFLQSHWCLQEVHMTTSFDPSKLVVVMYKDVLFSGVHIPTEVRTLLETTTYIEWHEQPTERAKLFWKRLRKALYNKHQMSQRADGHADMLLSEI